MNKQIVKESRKFYWLIVLFILLGLIFIGVSYLGKKSQTGARGYISGETEWTKARKQATILLLRYMRTGDDEYFHQYEQSLTVIFENRQALSALSSNHLNREMAYDGLDHNNNEPEEIHAMIWIFRNFQTLDPVDNAIEYWKQGDQKIDELGQLAEEIRTVINENNSDSLDLSPYYERIFLLDSEMTEMEKGFSAEMSQAAKILGNITFWTTIGLSVIFILIAGSVAVTFMRNVRRVNYRLRRSERKFRNVLNHSQDVIYQINIGAHKYDYMSTSVEDMLGYNTKTVMEGGPSFILDKTHPGDVSRMEEKIDELDSEKVEKMLVRDSEFRVKKADGEYIWVNNKRSLLRDKDGNPAAVVGNVRDISDQKKQMEQLDRSLNEKKTLLAEIHHRVKNNLAIVSSLMELQKEGADEELKISFMDVQSRIKSIALIHEKLYETTIFSEVELSEYLRELAEMISDTYRTAHRQIDITFDLEEVTVDMTQAVPVGLICNELLNNCFKHAFKNTREGEIYIATKTCEGEIEVRISDNGDGLPASFDLNNAQSLGVTLINILTEQVDGEMKVDRQKYTQFRLTFPIEENAHAEIQAT